MLRRLYLVLFLSVCFFNASAIEAAFSHVVYYLPDPIFEGKINPYIEAYWQINPKKLHYNTNADKKIIARIDMHIIISDDTGHVIKDDSYTYQTIPSDNVSQLGDLNILELKRYFIRPGKLKIQVLLTDLNDTTNKAQYSDTFTVSKVPEAPFYGGVEFIDTSYTSDIRTPFRKHGKQVIPLCENFFDTYRNTLNYYTELYQLNKVSDLDYPLVQSVVISKKEGQDPYGKLVRIDTIRGKDFAFYEGSFDIGNLPSGNYYFNVSLGNKMHQTIASRVVFFQRMNTKPITAEAIAQKAATLDTSMENINVLDLGKTFLKKYDFVQIKAMLKMILPLSDVTSARAIEGFLKKPEELYMRYFLYNFFLALDKEKPERAWKEYSEKVKEANKLYTSRGKTGYETVRGFMYLRYGAPSEVIPVVNEKGSLPYEVWQYNNLKEMNGKNVVNAVILFYKRSETDADFQVLHTTISGEPHNVAWRNFLYVTPDGGSNMNSRAEQFIGSR